MRRIDDAQETAEPAVVCSGDDQVWSVSGILTVFESGAKFGQLTKG